jgi:hypothetical protein
MPFFSFIFVCPIKWFGTKFILGTDFGGELFGECSERLRLLRVELLSTAEPIENIHFV